MAIYKSWYLYITSVCLNVTDSCNLGCRYCFVNNQPHFMTYEIAKDTIDFLYENYNKKAGILGRKNIRTPNVTFFGGEPMIMYDEIIKPIVEYTEETYPNLFSFNITTNGTLLNKRRINFFYKHKIPILLSIDGGETTQNYNRPLLGGGDSFKLVWKNVPYLLKKFPNTTFRGTIDKNTVEYVYENYRAAEDGGFTQCFFTPNSRDTWSDEQKEILKYQTSLIFTRMTNYFLNGYTPKTMFSPFVDMIQLIINHDITVMNEEEMSCKVSRNVERCGLGTTSASVGYDGKIYGCQEQTSQEDNIFYIGDIYNGINPTLHSLLLDEYSKEALVVCENPERCNNCLLRYDCKAKMCPSMTYERFKSFFINSDIACYWNQILFDFTRALMDICVKNNSVAFSKFLDIQCGMAKKVVK